jgi:hypothetical protein
MAKAASYLMMIRVTIPLLGALPACAGAEPVGSAREPLVAICSEDMATVPRSAWLCGAPRTIECDAHPGTASPKEIYVVQSEGCEAPRLMVDEGPFALGERDIVVSEPIPAIGVDAPTSREVCRSRLTVIDRTPPVAAPANTQLWPPNHAMHAITAQQCSGVVDACDREVDVRFTSASSDEPVDARGDGSHQPDIAFDSSRLVSLRSERQGGSNGRVYMLGWQATDASGNVSQGTCSVLVPHDASGRSAIPDAPAYEVSAPRDP